VPQSPLQSLINISLLLLKTLVGLSNKYGKIKQVQRGILLKVSGPVNKVCSFSFRVLCSLYSPSKEYIFAIDPRAYIYY